mmetsp:Transcript_11356/g.11443  ORF Transcript_11356/g.11443 Transcript_11356/m.11443 type:complete len:441 (+) Transcript_11356:73-1395(+)
MIEDEEKEMTRMKKKFYKEELDRQLQEKANSKFKNLDELDNQKKFLQAQQEAIKSWDQSLKKETKNTQEILSKEYENQAMERSARARYERELAIREEQEKFRKMQEEIENERKKQYEWKNEIVKKEQEVLKELELKKKKQQEQEEMTRLKDKETIENRIKEMEALEYEFQNFYNKRLNAREQRMKNYTPVLHENNILSNLMKRNEEIDQIAKERQALKEQTERQQRESALNKLKSDLELQIEESLKKQEIEKEEKAKIQKKINYASQILENERLNLVERRAKEKEYLRKSLELQLKDQQNRLNSYERMSEREKEMHKNILSHIDEQEKIAFPGIPGSHTAEPSLKEYSKFYLRGDNSNTPIVRNYSLSVEGTPDISSPAKTTIANSLERKSINFFVDPNKHDPIVNPIGSKIPNAIQGQRMARPNGSLSKLAQAGGSIFN